MPRNALDPSPPWALDRLKITALAIGTVELRNMGDSVLAWAEASVIASAMTQTDCSGAGIKASKIAEAGSIKMKGLSFQL